jgi:hypothetical protein
MMSKHVDFQPGDYFPSNGNIEDGELCDVEFADLLEVDDDDFVNMKQSYQLLRALNVVVNILVTIISFSNLLTSYSTFIELVSLLILSFSILLLLLEVFSCGKFHQILLSFGPIYLVPGKTLAVVFMVVLCFQLPFFGYLAACLLVFATAIYLVVRLKYPKYDDFIHRKVYFQIRTDDESSIQLNSYAGEFNSSVST